MNTLEWFCKYSVLVSPLAWLFVGWLGSLKTGGASVPSLGLHPLQAEALMDVGGVLQFEDFAVQETKLRNCTVKVEIFALH